MKGGSLLNKFFPEESGKQREFELNLKDMCENGLFDDAQAMILKELQQCEASLGKEHPGLTPYLGMLTEIYESLDLKEKAMATRRRILRIWENTLIPHYGFSNKISDIFKCKVHDGEKVYPFSVPLPIVLSEDLHLATGDNRICYAFPNEPDKCIKIDKPWNEGLYNTRKKRTKRIFMPWLADFSSNRDEARFYRKRAITLGEKFYDHAPRCYGIAITNLGPGLVFERIRNNDGSSSVRLDKFLTKNPGGVNHIITLLNDFYRYLCQIGLPVYCWNYKNLVIRKGADKDSVLIIDWKSQGKPNNDIPLINFSRHLKMDKMERNFKNLISLLENETGH